MLITDAVELKKFSSKHRLWQGIPGIEVTDKGRIFSVFYSGGVKEGKGNFVVLLQSDDGGKTFSEPIAVAFREQGRCYDSAIWIDPMGRLWWVWTYASIEEESRVYAAICDDPDADELTWSDIFPVGKYVMLNKPTVLSTGEWLFPLSVWDPMLDMIWAMPPEKNGHKKEESGAFVYKSVDHNTTFKKMGCVCADKRSFDEHMILELKNGRLMMLIRTAYGIAVSYSYDQGHTWTEAVDSKIGGPCSRFFIRRLSSGRILLVNHYKFKGRNNMTALLSEDECQTWKYSLLLDERSDVSYPDAVEAKDGYIYITYDRERGDNKKNLDMVMNSAREILLAKITEKDIMAGELVDPNSQLKVIISKLSEYVDDSNPLKEVERFSDVELAEELCHRLSQGDEFFSLLFDHYPVACENMRELDVNKLDALFTRLKSGGEARFSTALEIVRLIRAVSVQGGGRIPVVDLVEKMLGESICDNLSISTIAAKLHISEYYLMHTFKKRTGITIGEYKTALQISKAKILLREKDKSISEISALCGFESPQYFSRVFKKVEGISPSKYKNLNFS